jgi:integrase
VATKLSQGVTSWHDPKADRIRYRVRLREVPGRPPRSYYFDTPADANAKAAAILLDRKRGARPVDAGAMTVGQWLEEWLALVRPGLTRRSYDRYAADVRLRLVPTFGHIRLAKLSEADVARGLVAWENAGLSASTRRMALGFLRMALNRAMIHKPVALVGYNVAASAPTPTVFRRHAVVPSMDDMDRMRELVADRWYGPLFLVAMGTAMRQGETLGLRWSDVVLDGPTPHIRVSSNLVYGTDELSDHPKRPKSVRIVPLPEDVGAVLRRHRQESGPFGYVFHTRTGRPLHARNVLRLIHRVCAELGLPRMTWHDLRHERITRALEAGVPITVVGAVAGHSAVRMTELYGHVDVLADDRLRAPITRPATG